MLKKLIWKKPMKHRGKAILPRRRLGTNCLVEVVARYVSFCAWQQTKGKRLAGAPGFESGKRES